MSSLSIVILAAGKGTRMKSALPKVLHPVVGVPMIGRVLDAVGRLKPAGVAVIVGHDAERVKAFSEARRPGTRFFEQTVLDGSGGAVRRALPWLRGLRGDVIVTCGDAPLITVDSFRALLAQHRREKNAATVLTVRRSDPSGYGRIVRGADGRVERIVEHLDATPAERSITEINSGTYVFDARALARVLPKLSNRNAKREFYLTDTLDILRRGGGRVGGTERPDAEEIMGINGRAELAQAEAAVYRRNVRLLMDGGVTVVDPASTFVGDDVRVGADTVIWPQTFLLGRTRIGRRCQVGPWSHVSDCVLGDDVQFVSSFGEKSTIGPEAKVGPFSRVRPGSRLGARVHLGNFSEVKNSHLEEGAKANHLSYLGDATVGKSVNIGAGVITCNYDGTHKHPTRIDDHAFIGSNVNLIAPVHIGARAVIGAGSSIAKDVPADALALERAKPLVREGWAKARRGAKK